MLYRKYRPQTFDQVVGQEHVIQTLRGALTSGRLGHAYLFTGPRGSGKTSIARLLAKALNCQHRSKDGDCDDKCPNCLAVNENRSLDVIEIDAASNRNIDDIRNIKESASVASFGGNYKVFIVDEVHMLHGISFNAFLKILEEPPSHVVFIFATTEPHKIPVTILSRVQRFDFKRLTPKQILGKITLVSKLEKLDIEKEGLEAIARSADGALREAEVSLSKVAASFGSGKKITALAVAELLGLVPVNYLPEFLGLIASNDKPGSLDFIKKITDSGVDLDNFTKSFIEYLRRVMMHRINRAVLVSVGEELAEHEEKLVATYAEALTSQKMILMLNTFISAREAMKTSPIPQLPLELAAIELIKDSRD